jgi:hypothetical protein
MPKDGLEKRLEMVKGFKPQHTFMVASLDDSDLINYLDVMLTPAAELAEISSKKLQPRSEKYLTTWVKVQILKLQKSVEMIEKSNVDRERKQKMKAFITSELQFMQSL